MALNKHLREHMGKMLEHFQHIGQFIGSEKPAPDLFMLQIQKTEEACEKYFSVGSITRSSEDVFCRKYLLDKVIG